MNPYILGLDLGTNSIGWAMLAMDPETGEPCGFADTSAANHPPMGVRVFEVGIDDKTEEPLNAKRRMARSMRRNHARRNARRRRVRQLLAEAGLLPADRDAFDQLMHENPYELRARALIGALTPHELGRALYHIAQRRGFKSNRKSGDAKEDEGILAEIGELAKAIADSGCRTLGEYLHSLVANDPDGNHLRIRTRHTRRDMYENEFDAIVAQQRGNHGATLTDDFVEQLRDAIFFQHPFEVTDERRQRADSRANLHRSPQVRPCRLEPTEPCGPKGDWAAQQFRILKEVANLRISVRYEAERDLTADERAKVVVLLSAKERVKFDALRKALVKAEDLDTARFNLERGGRNYLLGNSVEHKLASAFGARPWAAIDDGDKARLRGVLLEEEDPEQAAQQFIRCGLDPEKAQKLAKWMPADGYLGYSLAAVRKLLPLMEAGKDEYAAIQAAYPDRPAAEEMDRLPPLDSRDLPPDLQQLTNPVVRRALVETRKVVNALVREHGVPARIVVELARELKMGREKRKAHSKMVNDRNKLRTEAAKRAQDLGGNPSSREDVNRWLYWNEQGGRCVYTGKTIPVAELFQGAEWEVDHILPHWRSLDDSMMNKVLVHRSANRDKNNRTPAEWLGPDTEAYRQLLARARRMGNLPTGKVRRLEQRNLDDEAFTTRQLKDTQYITTAVVRYLSVLYAPEMRVGEKAIQSSRGGLTAELRRQWGLNTILSPLYNADGKMVRTDESDKFTKRRDDHRHHAVDALVTALATRGMLKKYQDYWQVKDNKGGGSPDMPVPWADLRGQAEEVAARIVVSHRAMRKIDGALHEETFYGPVTDDEGNIRADRYVCRKPLSGLKGKMVRNIRDKVVREIVEARLRERGWDGQSNDLPNKWDEEPLYMPSGIPIRRVRYETVIGNAMRIRHRYAALGNNHHVVICEDPGLGGMSAEIVPMFKAASRVRRAGQDAVLREYTDGRRFVLSLARKETVCIGDFDSNAPMLCVLQKMSGDHRPAKKLYLVFRDVRDARRATDADKSPYARIQSFPALDRLKISKVTVDPIGRISVSND